MSELRFPASIPKDELKKLPVHEREQYVKEMIRKTINMNSNGITAKQLKKNLGFDPRAIDKHLSVMIHTNEIYTINYDRTSVYFPNGRALHPILEKSFMIDENKSIEIFQLRNKLGEYIYMQEKENSDYRVDTGGGLLIPVSRYSEFVDYMRQTIVELMRRR
jgi:hypothetical protein